MIAGSRTLATDTGSAIRAWLVFTTDASRLPVILSLGEWPYGSQQTPMSAHFSANDASRELLGRVRTLNDDQVLALVQQDDGRAGNALVERILRYWERPRLFGVDWLRFGPPRTPTFISAIGQDSDHKLEVGSKVMLAGDR